MSRGGNQAASESRELPRSSHRGALVKLFHYCCRHSANAITQRGFLRPQGRDLFGVDLIWLTDQAIPDREGLGLTSHIQPCDRLEFQYVVQFDAADVERWMESPVRAELARDSTFHEFEDGRQPHTWWVAYRPIYAIRNRAYSPLVVLA